MKRVEAIISPKSEVRLETFGYVGKSCMDVDKALKGLSDNIEVKKKAEYFGHEEPNIATIVGTN